MERNSELGMTAYTTSPQPSHSSSPTVLNYKPVALASCRTRRGHHGAKFHGPHHLRAPNYEPSHTLPVSTVHVFPYKKAGDCSPDVGVRTSCRGGSRGRRACVFRIRPELQALAYSSSLDSARSSWSEFRIRFGPHHLRALNYKPSGTLPASTAHVFPYGNRGLFP